MYSTKNKYYVIEYLDTVLDGSDNDNVICNYF